MEGIGDGASPSSFPLPAPPSPSLNPVGTGKKRSWPTRLPCRRSNGLWGNNRISLILDSAHHSTVTKIKLDLGYCECIVILVPGKPRESATDAWPVRIGGVRLRPTVIQSIWNAIKRKICMKWWNCDLQTIIQCTRLKSVYFRFWAPNADLFSSAIERKNRAYLSLRISRNLNSTQLKLSICFQLPKIRQKKNFECMPPYLVSTYMYLVCSLRSLEE